MRNLTRRALIGAIPTVAAGVALPALASMQGNGLSPNFAAAEASRLAAMDNDLDISKRADDLEQLAHDELESLKPAQPCPPEYLDKASRRDHGTFVFDLASERNPAFVEWQERSGKFTAALHSHPAYIEAQKLAYGDAGMPSEFDWFERILGMSPVAPADLALQIRLYAEFTKDSDFCPGDNTGRDFLTRASGDVLRMAGAA